MRDLASLWRELGNELARTNAAGKGRGGAGKVPVDLDVVDARRDIEGFTLTYIQMLMSDDPRFIPPTGFDDQLEALAMRIGHFTHHEVALVAYGFDDDARKVHEHADKVAHPSGRAWIPLGRVCFEYPKCSGSLRVSIDRDKPMDERSLALWQPVAVCDLNGNHKILAKLLRETTPETLHESA
jgi:hypothetical protein